MKPELEQARQAQSQWAALPIRRRQVVIRAFRGMLAAKAEWVAQDVAEASGTRAAGRAGVAETLTSEALPLCDAAKFLQREARYWLKPQRLGWRGRPAWLFGVSASVRREPVGVVLAIAAGNYPLLLPGVQALQALAAGNAVVLKPGRGGSTAAGWLADLLKEAGLPTGLLTVTDETVEAATGAIDAGVDKVFLTGSVDSGRAVLRRCAETLTPACVELSGSDVVFLLPGSDDETVAMAARAVAFGLRLNGSQTCIAPRRVFVDADLGDAFVAALRDAVRAHGPVPVDQDVMRRVMPMIESAAAEPAERVCGHWEDGAATAEPFVLDRVEPQADVTQADVFAPVVSVFRCPRSSAGQADPDDALLQPAARCPYALGASVFGPTKHARAFAAKVDAGSVCVNDLIVPTADPRLPFGGRRHSGFGVTRGAEGLLEMTRVKAVSVRRGAARPHYDPVNGDDAAAFSAYLRVAHGRGVAERLGALPSLIRGLKSLSRKQ